MPRMEPPIFAGHQNERHPWCVGCARGLWRGSRTQDTTMRNILSGLLISLTIAACTAPSGEEETATAELIERGGNVEACKQRCDVELENNNRKCDSAPPENRRACRAEAMNIYSRCLRECERRDIDAAWTSFSQSEN